MLLIFQSIHYIVAKRERAFIRSKLNKKKIKINKKIKQFRTEKHFK